MGTLSLLLTGCYKIELSNFREISKQYYSEIQQKELDSIEKAIESFVFMHTKTTDKSGQVYEQDGFGVAYERFILTLNHIVSQDEIVTPTPFGRMTYYIDKEKEETTLGGVTIESIVKDKEKDIAVFRLPYAYRGESYPFGLGDSDKIRYTQEILLIGNPAYAGFNVREGIVSGKVQDGMFAVSANISGGDSGTITVDRHTFQILGINAERHYETIAKVRAINLFKPYLHA